MDGGGGWSAEQAVQGPCVRAQEQLDLEIALASTCRPACSWKGTSAQVRQPGSGRRLRQASS